MRPIVVVEQRRKTEHHKGRSEAPEQIHIIPSTTAVARMMMDTDED